jgi:NifU-like protein involved in Fe-S cluster formation
VLSNLGKKTRNRNNKFFMSAERTSHLKAKTEDHGDTRQLSAFEYLMRGFRRNGGPLLAIVGRVAHDGDGRTAQFSVEVEDGVIKAVSFAVSTCATLIAYCEFVAEGVTGATLSRAVALTPEQVIAPLKGIPPHKYDCARLATTALRGAVEIALNGGQK